MDSIFLKRLRDLREDQDKTQEEIARLLKTTKQYYQKYEKGIHPLPLRHLSTLADFYGVSADYILGRTNERKPYPRD